MKRWKYGFGLVALFAMVLGGSNEADAVYTSNTSAKITNILTYDDSNIILIQLDNQSTLSNHPCNHSYFAIDPATPEDRLDRMYSRAMLAFGSGTPINIGFDGTGNCVNGYMRVHRVG